MFSSTAKCLFGQNKIESWMPNTYKKITEIELMLHVEDSYRGMGDNII